MTVYKIFVNQGLGDVVGEEITGLGSKELARTAYISALGQGSVVLDKDGVRMFFNAACRELEIDYRLAGKLIDAWHQVHTILRDVQVTRP
jgi:hypothetical protein